MPRRQLQFVQGAYYHIYNRGARRRSIFRTEENYLYLLRLIKAVAAECQITMIAYSLLPNHYHWLVRQDGAMPAQLLPQRVFGSYTRAFNNVYRESGTLFEGRFQAKLVDSDEYLRHLCRYIHINPVKHGFAIAPELWPYSNYAEWIGTRSGTLVNRTFVVTHFPAAGQYQRFVLDYLAGRDQMPGGLSDYLLELEG
ncbi:MAG: transposase [Caldilineaceae bacterium]|nr:transposase [Caldilineaceae bacterium]